ncbi:MAG TPA: PQQ-dependent sugar dehydrogenase [Mycobacteriales bacterium]|jgi:glucose/arabinose dehydrogenase|nr:PQQ-dependent sugar dehydrogenase [Mycobacteriales bacterium]
MRRAAACSLALALATACTSGSPDARPTTAPPASPSATATTPASPSASASGGATPGTRTGTPRLELVATFDSPVHVTAPPGDPRLFVVEQPGRVRVVKDGRVLPAPFLDIAGQVKSGGEQGLLSIAFAPDYARSGLCYVYYTDNEGDTRVVEYHVSGDPDRADPASRRQLLFVDQPFPNHNGGLLLFDPSGRLLIGLGDGGSGGDPRNNAQDLDRPLGKILRVDPRPTGGRPYGIPADNPFAGTVVREQEIWAFGLRNPWRFSFDPETGDLYLADVGQDRFEEVNVVSPARQPGANYGWRVFEGKARYRDGQPARPERLVAPVHTYDHGGDRCSVTGGVVYRGSVAALRGRYLFGDYCSGELWSFPAGTGDAPAVTPLPFGGGHPTSFGVDSRGEVYLASADGEVWRITA